MKKRVFIYIRVSTTEQAEEGYSLGEQESRLIKYCEAMGWEVIKVYIDPGYSGGSLERPAVQEMISEVKKGNADIVLVDKLDRLSRSQFDTLYLIQKVFTPNECAFVSRAEAFDTSTPFGRAMVGILAVFAELERERIKERMQEGKNGRAKEGKYRGGGYHPTGYDYDPLSGYLIENEYDAMQVREAFDLFNQRMPIYTICSMFNNKGYRTKDGPWNDTRLRGILSNKTYIGKLYHKGEWYEGGHDPIIDTETFQKAQQILAEREIDNEHKKVSRRYKAPLGGLIWCNNCGGRYHYRNAGQRAYYICYSREKSDPKMIKDINCKNKTYRDFALEHLIFDEVRKLKSNENYIGEVQDSVDEYAKLQMMKDRVIELSKQINNLMDLFSIGSIDMNAIKAKIEPLSIEKSSLEVTIEELESGKTTKKSREDIVSLVDVLNNAVAENDSYTINTTLHELIEKIIIDDEDVKIYWNF